MEMITLLLVSLVFLVAILWYLRHDPNLPPCPRVPLPILGHLLFMDKNPRNQFKQWRKKCGEIYSLYLGQRLAIVLNGYDLFKEAIVTNADICSDRPYVFFDVEIDKMEMTTLLLVSFVFLVAILWYLRHNPNLPACPRLPLPILGHLPYMDKNPRNQFKQWRKKCGEIYSLYLGQRLVIVLNGYDLIKEALVTNGEICSDRPYVFFDAVTDLPGLGVSFSSGAVWKEHRAVTVTILRALGIGNNVLVEKVIEVVATNNEVLVNLKGVPTDIDDIITCSVANVICSIMIGNRFNHDDEQFLDTCRSFRENVKDADGSNLANYFKFWPYLPGDLFKAKGIHARTTDFMTNFVKPYIKQKGYDEFDENNLDNFIARYVYEMNKRLKAGEATTMSEDNLMKVIFDLFSAGTETISMTIQWCLLYFLHYPETQEKVYQEIEREVGTERIPNMSDKYQLPYLNAYIMEVQRIASIVPLNVPHMCSDNLTIAGYTIPKGTQIMASLDSVLFDKKIWGEDADVLKPERFLDEYGKVKTPQEFVPFALGKRVCPGESMAKVEMFLFLSSMVQRFEFLPADSGPLPLLVAQFGLTACPPSFKVRVVERP